MKRPVAGPGLAVGLCLLSAPVQAAVLRVPSQFPTIQQAVNAASAGDTVVVAEGTYAEAVTLKGGVRLHAAENADVVIDASGVTVPGDVDYVVGWAATPSHIEVVGFTLIEDNAAAGVGVLAAGSNHLVEDNIVRGAFKEGIRLDAAANTVVVGNEIWGVRDTGGGGQTLSGILLDNGSGNRILNNFAFSGRHGIAVIGGGSNFVAGNVGFAGSFFGGMIGVLVRNSPGNVLANNTAHADGPEGATGVLVDGTAGLRIVNCIVTGSDVGLRLNNSSGVMVSYTIINGQTDISGAGAVLGPGVLVGVDPMLASPVDGDFRLQQGSPARNAGRGTDRDGTRADLGAYGGIY